MDQVSFISKDFSNDLIFHYYDEVYLFEGKTCLKFLMIMQRNYRGVIIIARDIFRYTYELSLNFGSPIIEEYWYRRILL